MEYRSLCVDMTQGILTQSVADYSNQLVDVLAIPPDRDLLLLEVADIIIRHSDQKHHRVT